jgi:hypothetical protein
MRLPRVRFRYSDAAHSIIALALALGWVTFARSHATAPPDTDREAYVTMLILAVASVAYPRFLYGRYRRRNPGASETSEL